MNRRSEATDHSAMTTWRESMIRRGRYTARRTLNRIDNEELRKARKLVRRLRSDPPDVLYVGDSTAAWIAPTDTDRRRLCVMVTDLLTSPTNLHAVYGGSYHADLIESFVSLVGQSRVRPTLVVPLWIRGRYVPWIEHPIFGHRRAMDEIRSIGPGDPVWRIRAGFPRPTSSEFARFYQLPFTTLAGELTIRDYVQPLKNPDHFRDTPADRVKLLYAYHQGAELHDGSPELAAVTRLGATIRDLGCEVVVYQTPVPVVTGVKYHGQPFATLAQRNFAVLDAAFRKGIGRDVDIIQSGLMFEEHEFIDPDGADEHLNQTGRVRLAQAIADRLSQVAADKAT
ncbi:MAG: hypothetical protein LC797_24880 [Chloroflexi bacterium]|nr:hypothetical protein [Chloroflexota bacterium]